MTYLHSRLADLLALRDRVNEEIAHETAQRARIEADRQLTGLPKMSDKDPSEEQYETLELRKMAPAARVRRWARSKGIAVSERGTIPDDLRALYVQAHGLDMRNVVPLRPISPTSGSGEAS